MSLRAVERGLEQQRGLGLAVDLLYASGAPVMKWRSRFPGNSSSLGICTTLWGLPVCTLPGALAHLALERLHIRVNDHVCFQGLFLHKTLVAEVTLVGANIGVDQHMSLHVGQQSELPPADPTLVLLHTLDGGKVQKKKTNKRTHVVSR